MAIAANLGLAGLCSPGLCSPCTLSDNLSSQPCSPGPSAYASSNANAARLWKLDLQAGSLGKRARLSDCGTAVRLSSCPTRSRRAARAPDAAQASPASFLSVPTEPYCAAPAVATGVARIVSPPHSAADTLHGGYSGVFCSRSLYCSPSQVSSAGAYAAGAQAARPAWGDGGATAAAGFPVPGLVSGSGVAGVLVPPLFVQPMEMPLSLQATASSSLPAPLLWPAQILPAAPSVLAAQATGTTGVLLLSAPLSAPLSAQGDVERQLLQLQLQHRELQQQQQLMLLLLQRQQQQQLLHTGIAASVLPPLPVLPPPQLCCPVQLPAFARPQPVPPSKRPRLQAAPTTLPLSVAAVAPFENAVACMPGSEEWLLRVLRVLGMSEQTDATRLALHCWRRVADLPQMHHATRMWPNAAAGRALYATACAWVAIKLEVKRATAPGGTVLAHIAGATPGALCAAELALMSWLGWRPYEGFRLDESHLLYL